MKKPGVMDIVLIFIAVSLVVFTVVMIRTFWLYGAIPDTLCTCVFGVLGTECGAMAWIKTTKERRRERKWELEDRDHEEKREDNKKQ
ncbi:MAG: hypothetical protein IJX94_01470 [Clostridia bacterium]|nr:hypothetical protein [Clostridia bacterium]